MKDPNIKTEVIHSQSKSAWNIIGKQLGGKYKIARIPYLIVPHSEILTTKNKYEALIHANFISQCFNNSCKIVNIIF